ncbi:MAG: PhnD/SsuA/transferrin family substrate-binding protein [Leptolyngbya sp. UWPOB_LEPTO1]|uniref:phosphate/phosphite/phosphonate ABC transporter substrate-binding protein n=1 Tax=Leptolyngbya sp. UWPOB_LEPTO1 TaxID=2815653 RepID=UPI001ACF91D4|nr:PhnD/SsuA/transferrin family substrate-binding protein [Leptolyngbya sp. UWPOB_LEPTO1]MBN8564825.1 PhnD/SsuA/transferrin family substrate-binding protein [Leptolyngbya sp. UWPOB_LEPTO1]
MDNASRKILRELVEELGSNIPENLQKWRGYLNDRLAYYKLERQALTTALNDSIPEELLSSQVSVSPQVQIERLALRLVEHHGLQPEVARWAVESWALALGISDSKKLESDTLKPKKPIVPFLPKGKSEEQSATFVTEKQRLTRGLLALGVIGAIAVIGASASVPTFFSGISDAKIKDGSTQMVAPINTLTVGVYVPPPPSPGQNPAPQGQSNQPPFNPKEGYETLVEYLRAELPKRFGRNIDVKIEFIEATGRESFEEVRAKLKTQAWDMVFTFNPLLSASAIQNKYEFAARNRRSNTDDFKVALVTRVDSPIRTLEDLNRNPETTIALGNIDSPFFYVPVYDSYGRTLRVDPNNATPVASSNKVLEGKADVGVIFSEWITDEPPTDLPERFRALRQRFRSGLRLISASRAIPTAGVYLSPKIAQPEREQLRKALLEAPEETRRAARYSEGTPGDYAELLKIAQRVDEFLACTDPTRWTAGEQIQFSCTNALTGRVNGFGHANEETEYLNLQLDNGKMHRVIIPKSVLANAGVTELAKLDRIAINGVKPNDQTGEVRITAASQIKPISAQ